MINNTEKELVWQAYRSRKPVRVPVILGINPRVVILDPAWNTRGITFREYFSSADALIEVQLAFMKYLHEYAYQYCDNPTGPRDKWTFYVDNQNIYDSSYFGCPVDYKDGQVPDVAQAYAGENKDKVFQIDLEHPLDNPFIRWMLDRYDKLKAAVAKLHRPGISFDVALPIIGFDGPLTVATNIRGGEFLLDLYEDPDYALRLMDFIQRGVILRNRALGKLLGKTAYTGDIGNLADDSIALISNQMYRQMVMPLHKVYYALWSAKGPHNIHLCGDSTRHFTTLRDECNVFSFDTGFPVNFGPLRQELGEDVEIFGGPEVHIMLSGTAAQVYERSKAILTSGIKQGGRFVLREANNLPPRVPEANLAAMYKAALDFGGY